MAKQKQSRGLGDTIAKVTKYTGIDKLVGDDCGCEKRKRLLNEKYSYRLKIVNCPTDEQKEQWNAFKNTRTLDINKKEKEKISKLYSFIFNVPYFETHELKPYIAMIDKIDRVID